MTAYILKRLFLFIPTLLGVTIVTFFLMKAVPGDPAAGMVGERAPKEVLEKIKRDLGEDRPVIIQYIGYLGLILKGELGRSYYTNRRVAEDIAEKLPNTFKLALAATLFATVAGIILGVISAVFRDSFLGKTASLIALWGISLPVFWVGLILMLIFALTLHWLPPSGTGTSLIYLVLPASTLGIHSAAYISRITRSSMLEVLSKPYIETARAKGLNEFMVVMKHALRNALIPIVTLIGIDFGSYLNGSVLTETIFGWDGMGRYALDGIMKRDYPVIMGTVLVGAVVFVAINLLVDISYSYLDPRIRTEGKG
ncbi:MAG: ABC transporter permease [Deltaproteobacteria bacterium]|nr:ABC transporter permease [Deltaproteobacteria bacterium]